MALATATIQLDTEHVRVTRWDFPPGTETGDHRHEFDYVVVPVVAGVLSIVAADGSEVDYPIAVGESYQRGAGTAHNVKNSTNAFVSFVEIELLDHPES